jgi:hypothetical protein
MCQLGLLLLEPARALDRIAAGVGEDHSSASSTSCGGVGFRLPVLLRSVDKAFEELGWLLPSRISLPVGVLVFRAVHAYRASASADQHAGQLRHAAGAGKRLHLQSEGSAERAGPRVLVGLVLNATLGWWWADPLAGFVIVF